MKEQVYTAAEVAKHLKCSLGAPTGIRCTNRHDDVKRGKDGNGKTSFAAIAARCVASGGTNPAQARTCLSTSIIAAAVGGVR